MLTLDFKNPPIWDQVKDAKYGDLEELGYFDRYELMQALGREYAGSMLPDTPEGYTRLIRQEMVLRDLYSIDFHEPVQYVGDEAALKGFIKDITESGKFAAWQEAWHQSQDSLKRRGVIYQIKREFGKAFGVDIGGGHIRVDNSKIMNADVADYSEDIVFNKDYSFEDDFLKIFHSTVFASARLYQQQLAHGKVQVEPGSEREDLAFRSYADLPPAASMFWDSDEFRHFMGQPTRKHASWLADTALQAVTADEPGLADEIIAQQNEGVQNRYLSEKVLYASSMKVRGPEDVWNAVLPISSRHIRNLSVDAQAAVVNLAAQLHGKGQEVPPELNKAIEKILTSYPLTPEYKKFHIQQQARLLKRMMQDSKVQDARQNWQSYTKDQKLDFLKHVTGMHADVFGYRPCRVSQVDLPPKPDADDPTSKTITFGWYNWGNNYPDIAINVNEEAGGLDHFFLALNTAMHESEHAFQDHLARQYKSGFLKPDSPLYEQARYFSVGRHVYVTHDQDTSHYMNNPLERDSFAFGNGVSFFIALANKDQRDEYAQRMEEIYDNPRGKDFDLSRGFQNVPWGHYPAMPEPEGYG